MKYRTKKPIEFFHKDTHKIVRVESGKDIESNAFKPGQLGGWLQRGAIEELADSPAGDASGDKPAGAK